MSSQRDAKRYSSVLCALLALFVLRVAGQLIQVISPTGYLPSLAAWQGSSLPYGLLFGIQVLIILMVAGIAYRIRQGRLVPQKRIGRVMLIVGAIYFTTMLLRLILGVTVLEDNSWFAKPIPAFFHLILAGVVLTIGHYYWSKGT